MKKDKVKTTAIKREKKIEREKLKRNSEGKKWIRERVKERKIEWDKEREKERVRKRDREREKERKIERYR